MKHPEGRFLAGRRVFVTGAASGIGRAVALRAAAQGAVLFLTDIDRTGLTGTVAAIRDAGGEVGLAQPADVSSYEQVRTLAEKCHADGGAMDVVMNVAGISAWGTVQTLEHRHWRSQVEVNLMGPIHVIESFVPAMAEAGRGGHLVNVSSAAGLVGLPWHAAYSASKYGLRGVSEVLRFDLHRHGIGVTLVCPGAVDTPLTKSVDIAGVDKDSPAFKRVQARFKRLAVTPDEVAVAILDGMRRKRYLVHTSPWIRTLHLVQRVLPPVYVLAMRLFNRVADRALRAAAPEAGR